MRAWTHTRAGPPSKVLTLLPHHVTPTLKSSTDVLVRISYASLSPGASIMMQLCPSMVRGAWPVIPELDFAGTVVGVGPDVARGLVPGVAVFGSVLVGQHMSAGAGTLAELVVVPEANVARVPENISLEMAAGLGISGCTALVLVQAARLAEGDTVLVNGASGGVGSMVLQMAKRAVGKDGRVVAICSGANVEMVKRLGADEVIDYVANAPVYQYLAAKYSKAPFDVIIDAHGVQELFTHCASYLAPGKPFVAVGIAFASYSVSSLLYACSCMLRNVLWPRLLGGVNRPYVQVIGLVSLPRLEKLAEMAGEGKLQVPVDSCWNMEDALKAYEIMLSGRAKGKIIVKVQDP